MANKRRSRAALTPEQEEVVWVEQLEAKEGKNDLQGERTAINKVTIEQLDSGVKYHNAHVLRLLVVLRPLHTGNIKKISKTCKHSMYEAFIVRGDKG